MPHQRSGVPPSDHGHSLCGGRDRRFQHCGPLLSSTVTCHLLRSFFLLVGRVMEAFADRHDANVGACLRQIFGMRGTPAPSQIRHLALSSGALGLTSAHRTRFAAHWASWADCLRTVKERHPVIAEMMIRHLQKGPALSFHSVKTCAQRLVGEEVRHAFLGRLVCDPLQRWKKILSPTNPRLAGNSRQRES